MCRKDINFKPDKLHEDHQISTIVQKFRTYKSHMERQKYLQEKYRKIREQKLLDQEDPNQ